MKISFHSFVKQNQLPSQKFRTKTRFEEEADVNSEMTY